VELEITPNAVAMRVDEWNGRRRGGGCGGSLSRGRIGHNYGEGAPTALGPKEVCCPRWYFEEYKKMEKKIDELCLLSGVQAKMLIGDEWNIHEIGQVPSNKYKGLSCVQAN
jgi:hypothetical protein